MLKLHHYHNATVETKTNRFPHHKNQDNRHIILCHCCKIHSHNQQCRFECRNEHLSIQNRKCTAHSCHKNHENCIWLNNLLICCNKKQQHDVHTIRNAFILQIKPKRTGSCLFSKVKPCWMEVDNWMGDHYWENPYTVPFAESGWWNIHQLCLISLHARALHSRR